MKFLLAAAALLVASFVASEEIDSRVTGGFSATSGLVKCYVALTIDSDNSGQKTCGGCLLLPEDKIVTAASCVFSQSEGKALAVTFFTSLAGPSGSANSNMRMNEIFKAADYDVSKNTSGSDLAIITLKNRVITSSSLQGSWPSTEDKADAFVAENLVVCGHGFVDNNRTRPGSKGLQCVTLRVVPVKDCTALLPPPPLTANEPPAPKGMICAKNIDDKNVCGGDQGSPVFSNRTGSLQLVGVVSYYPDARPNARCRDGHFVVITQLGNFRDFIQNPV